MASTKSKIRPVSFWSSGAIAGALAGLGFAVTPEYQSWWLAGIVWSITAYFVYRAYHEHKALEKAATKAFTARARGRLMAYSPASSGGFYVVLNDACVTNTSEARAPIEVSLLFEYGPQSPVKQSMKQLAKWKKLPADALTALGLSERDQIEQTVSVDGLCPSRTGYWAFTVGPEMLQLTKSTTPMEFVERTPIWLNLANVATGETVVAPINHLAYMKESQKVEVAKLSTRSGLWTRFVNRLRSN